MEFRSDIEARLGHAFRDPSLLETALTHSSHANESAEPCRDNEALEFLGDAVLTFAVADRLYMTFPGLDEGRLSRHKHLLTCRATLADVAVELGLDGHVRLGRGEGRLGTTNRRILANVFEAVLAAVHLDAGLEAARGVADRALATRVAALDPVNPVIDWKSALQEIAQGRGLGTPTYRVLETIGPDHDRLFRVAVTVDGEDLAQGEGRSKRIAQLVAARSAVDVLEAQRSP